MRLLNLVKRLCALPPDRRAMLVVRSMPFGDILEDDTRVVHFRAPQGCEHWHGRQYAYRICQIAKRGGGA